jgi:hypothetical protein
MIQDSLNLGAMAVTIDYKSPFEFKGIIKKVNFKLLRYKPKPEDNQNRFNAEMAKQ